MGLFSSDEKEDNGNPQEKKYYCDTCGKEISKEEFESNGGQCTNCVIEDGAIGGGLVSIVERLDRISSIDMIRVIS